MKHHRILSVLTAAAAAFVSCCTVLPQTILTDAVWDYRTAEGTADSRYAGIWHYWKTITYNQNGEIWQEKETAYPDLGTFLELHEDGTGWRYEATKHTPEDECPFTYGEPDKLTWDNTEDELSIYVDPITLSAADPTNVFTYRIVGDELACKHERIDNLEFRYQKTDVNPRAEMVHFLQVESEPGTMLEAIASICGDAEFTLTFDERLTPKTEKGTALTISPGAKKNERILRATGFGGSFTLELPITKDTDPDTEYEISLVNNETGRRYTGSIVFPKAAAGTEETTAVTEGTTAVTEETTAVAEEEKQFLGKWIFDNRTEDGVLVAENGFNLKTRVPLGTDWFQLDAGGTGSFCYLRLDQNHRMTLSPTLPLTWTYSGDTATVTRVTDVDNMTYVQQFKLKDGQLVLSDFDFRNGKRITIEDGYCYTTSKPYVLGDVDDDGFFRMSDSVVLIKMIFDADPGCEANVEAADYNHDGNVDLFDFRAMMHDLNLMKDAGLL